MGVAVRESLWLFPIIDSIHTVGIVFMAGTSAVVDLRLLDLGLRREPVSAVVRQVLPWTWAGFASGNGAGSVDLGRFRHYGHNRSAAAFLTGLEVLSHSRVLD